MAPTREHLDRLSLSEHKVLISGFDKRGVPLSTRLSFYLAPMAISRALCATLYALLESMFAIVLKYWNM